MRPPGEISIALLTEAREAPGTVRDLAERAQVGYAAARYTASRLVQRGELVELTDVRPVVLGICPHIEPAGADLADALFGMVGSFYGEGDVLD